MKKAKKSKLDEMQEMKLLNIEHHCCYIAIWGLLAVIVLQRLLDQKGVWNTTGESLVLLILSTYLVISCIKNGIWDRRLQPKFSTNMLISLVTGFVSGGAWFCITYYRYHALGGSIATFIVMMLFVTVLCQIALTLCTSAYHHRKAKLDAQADQEEREE